MAETLNLGTDGNWGVKKDSLLAYNSENGNYKPLPFSFSRASSATVVNKDGLIEVVTNNKPRIDFKDDAKGALLLEPTRSNFFLFSEYFLSGAWTKESSTIVADSSISPDGNLNATKLTSNTSSGLIRASYNSSIGVDHTFSFFIKNDNSLSSDITIRTSSTAVNSTINWTNNVLTSIINGTGVTDFESYGNGWYRVFTSYESIEAEQRCKIYASRNGDGASVYIYGAMIELGSYATSYIPTQGSAVTRVADVSSQTPPSGIIGQTEGAMLIDFIPKSKDDLQILFQVRTIGSSNVGQVDIRLQSGNIRCIGNDGGSPQFNITGTSFNVGERYKCAIRYKENDVAFYINGVLIGTDTTASFSSSSKNQISFSENLSSFLPIVNVKDARLYNTALTDAELQALTTL